MKNKHTQGEWEVFIQPAPHGTVRTINVGNKRIATLEQMIGIYESEANAKLIAAAPKMLRLLNEVKTFLLENDYNGLVVDDIEELINEANN
jgi:hypothetical protein